MIIMANLNKVNEETVISDCKNNFGGIKLKCSKWVNCRCKNLKGSSYSRMDQVKFVEGSP